LKLHSEEGLNEPDKSLSFWADQLYQRYIDNLADQYGGALNVPLHVAEDFREKCAALANSIILPRLATTRRMKEIDILLQDESDVILATLFPSSSRTDPMETEVAAVESTRLSSPQQPNSPSWPEYLREGSPEGIASSGSLKTPVHTGFIAEETVSPMNIMAPSNQPELAYHQTVVESTPQQAHTDESWDIDSMTVNWGSRGADEGPDSHSVSDANYPSSEPVLDSPQHGHSSVQVFQCDLCLRSFDQIHKLK
jgi:hypothetical protein